MSILNQYQQTTNQDDQQTKILLRRHQENITTSSENKDQECTLHKKSTIRELFLKSLIYFMIIFTIVGQFSLLIELFFRIDRMLVFFSVGLSASLLASYYKLMLLLYPMYRPLCNDCAQSSLIPSKQDIMYDVLTVLDHKKSNILYNIPNTILGVLFYSFLLCINIVSETGTYYVTLLFIIASCIVSMYLWYVMIYEVKSICVICSTIHAVSFLALIRLLACFHTGTSVC